MALLNAIVDFHCGRTLSVGHSTEAKLLRCIGLHAYPTGAPSVLINKQKLRKSTTNDNRSLEIKDNRIYKKPTF